MLFHTHLLLGITFFILLRNFFSGGNEIIFFLLVLLGSILPDIDDGKSKIKKASGILGSTISFIFKHRGMFHSLIFALGLFFLITFLWNSYYAGGLLLGYLSHLIGDAVTPMGINLFYPFSRLRLRGPIKVGSPGEWIILVMLTVVIVKILLF